MATTKLRYADKYYTPYHIKKLSESQIRSELNRLKRIANERLKRLSRYDKSLNIYRENRRGFKGTRAYKTRAGMERELMRVSRFIGSRESLVSGQRAIRRKALESLHNSGYTFVNESNFSAFGHYMGEMLALGYTAIYGSDRIAEAYNVAENKDVDINELRKDFEKFYEENKDEIES